MAVIMHPTSEHFGETPPPSDGFEAPCPACGGTGLQYFAPPHEETEVRCYDCLGTRRQGYGYVELANARCDCARCLALPYH
jgi:hypothetical protein